MPRQARLDAPGTLHYVITRGIERKKIVKDDHDRQNFVYRMGDDRLVKENLAKLDRYRILWSFSIKALKS